MKENTCETDKKHIGSVVKNNLCCFCGTCQAVCPIEAITMDCSGSFPVPIVDVSRCTQCGLCRSVCPGHEVDLQAITKDFLGQAYDRPMTGFHLDCFTGAVCDEHLRSQRTSGGLAKEIAIWGLENKRWDAVVVSQFSNEGFCRTKTTLAATVEEVERSAGSLYCPVTCGTVIRQIEKKNGTVCFIGLPCHIQALRKAQQVLPWLREKVCFTIGLFCSGTPGVDATRFFLKSHHIDPNSVELMVYRSAGWPGQIQVCLKDSDVLHCFPRGKANTFINHLKFATAFHHGGAFFHPRCSLCPDYFAELADISLGDAWKLHLDAESGGWNTGLVRSRCAEQIMRELQQAGRIVYNSIGTEQLLKSHKSSIQMRKNLLSAMNLHTRLGFQKPIFTGQPKGTSNFLLTLLCRIQWFCKKRAKAQAHWNGLWVFTFIVSFIQKLNNFIVQRKEA